MSLENRRVEQRTRKPKEWYGAERSGGVRIWQKQSAKKGRWRSVEVDDDNKIKLVRMLIVGLEREVKGRRGKKGQQVPGQGVGTNGGSSLRNAGRQGFRAKR